MVVNEDIKDLLNKPVEVRNGVAGIDHPLALLDTVPREPVPLLSLSNRHIVSSNQFSRNVLIQLCRLAADLETKPSLVHLPLSGKIMITAFYEPSTRTRLSFESAWHRLGGDVISITDRSTTGIAKGESLQDVAEMFSNYGDVVVLRDSNEKAVYEMLGGLRIPIINAGNGIDEHPTQALADVYTILKWRPELALPETTNAIRLGIIGTPNKMRTVRSLLTLLSLISNAIEEVVIINPSTDLFEEDQRDALEKAGLSLRVERQLHAVLPELDVVYINSIAWIGDTFERLTGDMKLTSASPLKQDAIVLHPLARGEELDTSLDATPHNWYFAQARGAIFIRMALLTSIMQRVSHVADVTLNPENN